MQLLQSSSGNRHSSRRRKRVRRLIWLVVIAAIVVGWTQRDTVLQSYRNWKQARLLGEARDAFEHHDPTDGEVALEGAFSAAPGRVETYRAAATILEDAGSPQALRLRRMVVQMMPNSVDDQAALILCAIRNRDYNLARDVLSSLTPQQASQPSALGAALAFALSTGDLPVADALFDRLRKLGGSGDDLKVGQAILHLRHPRPEIAAAARAELETLAANPKYTLRIHRELFSDAIQRRDYAAARQWAARVVADPNSNFADRLQQADIEVLVEHRPFADLFRELAPLAAASPDNAAGFARWMLVQGKSPEADRWLSGLPPAIRTDSTVAYVWAETVAQQKDWDRLAQMLEAGAWGQTSPDTVRLAMAAWLIRAHGGPALEGEVWDQAIQSAIDNLAALGVLQQLTAIWNWPAESERTLWAIARHFPDQVWATQALFNLYRSRNDTPEMREVMALQRDLNPSVSRYQHDWALLTLLLEPTEIWNRPKEILKQIYLDEPGNPYYATSYAFALAQVGKAKEALAIVNKMSAADRDYSPRLPYLAYVYGVNRQRTEVDRLEEESRKVALLPEERELFVDAHAALDARPVVPVKPAKPAAGGGLLLKS